MGPIVKRLATAVTTTVGTTDTYDFTMNGRQRARIYYRCSANPTGTPSVALALVALIPDFSTAADVPTTGTYHEGKETIATWPVSSGSDEPYVFPANGAIGAGASAADHKLMIMLETPVSELRVTVVVSGTSTHQLTYDLFAELI